MYMDRGPLFGTCGGAGFLLLRVFLFLLLKVELQSGQRANTMSSKPLDQFYKDCLRLGNLKVCYSIYRPAARCAAVNLPLPRSALRIFTSI